MSSAWQKFVSYTLARERSLVFDEEELAVVDGIKETLAKEGREECWETMGHEERLTIVRGFWDRAHRVRDMSSACIEIFDWRRDKSIDSILEERMPLHDEYHECWPSYVGGEDKYGHWILFDRVEEMQVGALSKYDEDTVLLYRAQCLEAFVRMKQETSKRLGYRVCQYIYILDLHGLSLKKHFTAKVRAILQPLFRVSGDYYPDSLWSLFIVNAPMSFRMIWRVISPWIDPVVKAKIRILAGSSMYLPAMQKSDIPLESIPKQLGGGVECITLQSVIEALIDTPEVENHGFTQNPVKADPKAVKENAEQLELIERRPSLLGRITKARNVKTFRKKSLAPESTATGLDAEAEEFYNEEDHILRGWLYKQGSVNTAWRRRYFVLTPTALYYFAAVPTKENHVPRGKIELHMISETKMHTPESEGADGLFDIVTPRRVFQVKLEADDLDDDDEELDVQGATHRWVEEITNASENDICAIDVEAVNDKSNESHVSAGFLHKRGAFNRGWRKRYFVLTSHALYYYTDAPTQVGASLKGRIDLYRVTATDVARGSTTEFKVQLPGRTYHLRAESTEEADDWLSTISTTVEKEQAALFGDADAAAAADGMVQPHLIREMDEEAQDTLGRTNSTMISGITSMAGEFLTVAAEMGILRKDDGEQPDQDTMLKDVQKRVMAMFRVF